jgi:DNA-binding PadR family transcriptional regulator
MKNLFLALLSPTPNHGYGLLQTYQVMFEQVLPSLNAGQIYTTLSRMERDGLVQNHPVEQEGKPDKRVYEITTAGKQALLAWFAEPISGPRLKDNFYLKLVAAQVSGLISPWKLIEAQREQYLQSLHDLNHLTLNPDIGMDDRTLLLIQGAILHLKADLEWLDLCEESFN